MKIFNKIKRPGIRLSLVCLTLFMQFTWYGDCLCEETADIICNWTNSRYSDGGELYWDRGINCGDEDEDGTDLENSTDTYWISNSGNSIIELGTTAETRFPGTNSARMYTDANIYATCNQNSSVERAEIHCNETWREEGRAREGNTVWMGWSEKWTDFDESHPSTVLQFRCNCGSGSPATEITLRNNRILMLYVHGGDYRTLVGTLEEDTWYDWIVEIKFAKDSTGYIKVWMYEAGDPDSYSYNDTPTAQVLNSPNMFDTDACPHLRWGVYRWDSGDYMPEDILEEDRIMEKYVGPVRWKYGNNLGAEGFDAVKPRAPETTAVGSKEEQQASNIPNDFVLHGNYPNPLNPSTKITYSLAQAGTATLTIFNSMGQKITTLVDQSMSSGQHSVIWDGTNDYGEAVAGGVYFYTLAVDSKVQMKKMVLIK